ncbi:MAG: hypothetical protein HUJ72_02225 [Blautia sp.]|nr:hypothetical protein [Blautia sp.]
MAPIFDNGNSMFWDAPLRGMQEDLTNITVNSFRTKEKDLLAYVINRNCVNIDRLPTMEELAGLYAKDPAILYIDALKAGYQKKIDMLEMYQRR